MANTTGKKYGGREKGTPNRLTKELRTILKDVLYNELEKIEELLDSLEPKERLELVIKILPFILPKVEKIGHTYNESFDAGFFLIGITYIAHYTTHNHLHFLIHKLFYNRYNKVILQVLLQSLYFYMQQYNQGLF